MGLKHKAKKGTVIEANGVKVTVLAGSPKLEVSAPENVGITIRPVRARPVQRTPRRDSK